MTKFVNTSPRLIIVGGVHFVPTQPIEVDDKEVLEHPGFKQLLESKDIEEYSEEKHAPVLEPKQQAAKPEAHPPKEHKS